MAGDDIIPVFTDGVTRAKLRKKYRGLERLWFYAAPNFSPVNFGALTVIPFPVRHALTAGFPTRGYLFKSRAKKILAYASDVSSLPDKTVKLLRHVPYLVLDGAFYLNKRMAAHLSVEQAVEVARQVKTRRLFLTQIGHTYPPHVKAENEIQKYFRQLKIHYPKTVNLAYDGMQLVI